MIFRTISVFKGSYDSTNIAKRTGQRFVPYVTEAVFIDPWRTAAWICHEHTRFIWDKGPSDWRGLNNTFH